MTFHVGQKVVCVDVTDRHRYGGFVIPVKGAIYTIRKFDDCEGVYLAEVVNPPTLVASHDGGRIHIDEPSFWLKDFRPIVDGKTDISIFTAMLTPNKTQVDA